MKMATAALMTALVILVGGAETRAQAPAGYETEPVLNAKDLAVPELLQGPHFIVDPKVPVKGFLERFTIRSPYGTFEAHGLHMLPIRVNEVEAIAKLDELSKTKEFAEAAGKAIARPVTSTVNMLARYRKAVAPIAQVSAAGPILGRTVGGALVAPMPVDYIA